MDLQITVRPTLGYFFLKLLGGRLVLCEFKCDYIPICSKKVSSGHTPNQCPSVQNGPLFVDGFFLGRKQSRVIPGTPNNGTPLWEASHTIPISLGILMGVVWESCGKLTIRGSLKIPLKQRATLKRNEFTSGSYLRHPGC